MKSLLLALGLAVASAAASQAMPVTPLSADSNVIEVAGGCGAGWHRGPHGRCLRNYDRPRMHRCPRGYHLSRYGHCRPNF